MAAKYRTNDTIASFLGALGDPTRDKSAGVYFQQTYVTDEQLIAAYRGSWLPRKIVNIPANDAVRKWRDWQADVEQIGKIEAVEQRLNVVAMVQEARIRARLFGGAAIFIGQGGDNLMTPFDPRKGVKYLTVMSRIELFAGPLEDDPTVEGFDKPKWYTVREKQIHPSRLVIFKGAEHPEPRYNPNILSVGWGDSVLVSLFESIKHFDSTMANVASLIFEANVDVFGVPDFMDSMTDPGYETRLLSRFALVAANKGINRSVLLDAKETYERKPASFASLRELIDAFFQSVSGGSDIPATRLLGMSPAGMSSTGESDLRNYYDRISAEQRLEMTPAMFNMDEAIIWTALGSRPEEITYIWASLWQITDKERAEIGKLDADTLVALNNTGLFPQEALAQAAATQLVEHSVYPGLETAIEDAGGFPDYEAILEAEQENQIALKTATAKGNPMLQDAGPQTLYVSRSVLNAADILRWAKEQGFAEPVSGDELHVTIVYSRTPVDWFKVGESWASKMEIAAGGPRAVEEFNGGAIVLRFASRELEWRHREIIEAGASSDYPEYSPHITFSYKTDIDLTTVTPYQGKIVLGPEIFQQVKA